MDRHKDTRNITHRSHNAAARRFFLPFLPFLPAGAGGGGGAGATGSLRDVDGLSARQFEFAGTFQNRAHRSACARWRRRPARRCATVSCRSWGPAATVSSPPSPTPCPCRASSPSCRRPPTSSPSVKKGEFTWKEKRKRKKKKFSSNFFGQNFLSKIPYSRLRP